MATLAHSPPTFPMTPPLHTTTAPPLRISSADFHRKQPRDDHRQRRRSAPYDAAVVPTTATHRACAGSRTSITALPTMSYCLHKLPYLSPEDAQPMIAHNSSPRSDESLRESMLWDSLAATQRDRSRSTAPTSISSEYLGCVTCNNAIALHHQAPPPHASYPLSAPAALSVPPSHRPGLHPRMESSSSSSYSSASSSASASYSQPTSTSPVMRTSSAHSLTPSTRSVHSNHSGHSGKKIFSLTPLDGMHPHEYPASVSPTLAEINEYEYESDDADVEDEDGDGVFVGTMKAGRRASSSASATSAERVKRAAILRQNSRASVRDRANSGADMGLGLSALTLGHPHPHPPTSSTSRSHLGASSSSPPKGEDGYVLQRTTSSKRANGFFTGGGFTRIENY